MHSACKTVKYAVYACARYLSGKPKSHSMDTSILSIHEIFKSAIESVLPKKMIFDNVKLDSKYLRVGSESYSLDKKIYVVAYGKAVVGMVTALHEVLGQHVDGGIAVIPKDMQQHLLRFNKRELLPPADSSVKLYEGAHLNFPDQDCLQASREIQRLVSSLKRDDLLLALTSGGGSALLTLPVPPLSLDDITTLTKTLSKAGASITELNTVRKHLDLLKGGGLARLAHPSQVVNLILSDIIGDPVESIASGPTARDPSTANDAVAILKKYMPEDDINSGVLQALKTNRKEQKLQELLACPVFPADNVTNLIIGSNSIALQATAQTCKQLGIIPAVLTSSLHGEASQVGEKLAILASKILTNQIKDMLTELSLHVMALEMTNEMLKAAVNQALDESKPLCLILGGETTVTVRGNGLGGRNQELCLSAAIKLSDLDIPSSRVTVASCGTDGQDGPTDSAGAIVTSDTVSHDLANAKKFLLNNDSYSYLQLVKDGECLIKTGLTATNVMDITLVFINFS